MNRPPHRPSAHVQPDPPAGAVAAHAAAPEESGDRAAVGFGWRLALFLLATSYVFLFAYEILSALFKLLFRK